MDEPTSPRPRGKLKVYLGYAAGVGKTYRMLDEGQQLKRDGVDVVVGYFEPHGRKDTIIKAQGLETVPRRKLEYRGARFEEMDSEAVLRRRPQVCLVDEFAHTNVPGSERAKRWQDVQVLLEGGIDVVTTVNVQHLESLNDQVWRASGIRVRETIPDWVIKQADEVVMIDLPPEALLNRLRRGAVYAPERAGHFPLGRRRRLRRQPRCPSRSDRTYARVPPACFRYSIRYYGAAGRKPGVVPKTPNSSGHLRSIAEPISRRNTGTTQYFDTDSVGPVPIPNHNR